MPCDNEVVTLAENMYAAYGKTTDYKNFRGDPMPTWEELPEPQKTAWFAASTTALQYTGKLGNETQPVALQLTNEPDGSAEEAAPLPTKEEKS